MFVVRVSGSRRATGQTIPVQHVRLTLMLNVLTASRKGHKTDMIMFFIPHGRTNRDASPGCAKLSGQKILACSVILSRDGLANDDDHA